jgi:hypothetical protein
MAHFRWLIKELIQGTIYKDVIGNWEINRKYSRYLPRTKQQELLLSLSQKNQVEAIRKKRGGWTEKGTNQDM